MNKEILNVLILLERSFKTCTESYTSISIAGDYQENLDYLLILALLVSPHIHLRSTMK